MSHSNDSASLSSPFREPDATDRRPSPQEGALESGISHPVTSESETRIPQHWDFDALPDLFSFQAETGSNQEPHNSPRFNTDEATLSALWGAHEGDAVPTDSVLSDFTLNSLFAEGDYSFDWPALDNLPSSEPLPSISRPEATAASPPTPSPPASARSSMGPRTRKRTFVDIDSIETSPPASKRQKISLNNNTSAQPHASSSSNAYPGDKRPRTVEEIDLIDEEDSLAATLRKQRAEQVKAQQQADPPTAKSKLTTLTCTVCLDTPTELTATACGHTFCHSCLMDWLVAAEKGDSKRTNCPACRHRVVRSKKGASDVIPLEIMKRPAVTSGGS